MLEGAPLLPRSNPFGFQRALPALQQPLLATKQALLLSKAELSECMYSKGGRRDGRSNGRIRTVGKR